MTQPPEDAALVSACLQREPGAWEALLDRQGPYLRRLIGGRLPPPFDPDAVFQDLWVALWEDGCRRLKGWDPARPLRPYLAAIALNLCRDHLARESRRRGGPLPEALPDPAPGPEAVAMAREVLEGLPSRERLAVTLVDLEGWSYAEAARVLGLTEGGLGALLSRARARLNKSMNP